ncbi:MAG: FKBP-type peptidyl-prolyl cis-trans isomerase [Bacteroidales bacterium]|nr:FKBP-type peptidyl-prolyl cis-trans isomerase [Bacteroidales bacterium]
MRIINKIFICILFVTLLSCSGGGNKQEMVNNVDKQELDRSLEKANRYMLLQESELINDYIVRHKLDVVQTGTGLRYQIIKEGEGEYIKKGDKITLAYELRLLNGDLIYSSEKEGNKTFLVGKGGVESGLEEAVLKLRKNSVAVVILPSHLAHGLLGDSNKIPPKAALVYKIKVIDKSNL